MFRLIAKPVGQFSKRNNLIILRYSITVRYIYHTYWIGVRCGFSSWCSSFSSFSLKETKSCKTGCVFSVIDFCLFVCFSLSFFYLMSYDVQFYSLETDSIIIIATVWSMNVCLYIYIYTRRHEFKEVNKKKLEKKRLLFSFFMTVDVRWEKVNMGIIDFSWIIHRVHLFSG